MRRGVLMRTNRGIFYLERPSDYSGAEWTSKTCYNYCHEEGFEEHNANKLILMSDKLSDKSNNDDRWYDDKDNFENIQSDLAVWGAGFSKAR